MALIDIIQKANQKEYEARYVKFARRMLQEPIHSVNTEAFDNCLNLTTIYIDALFINYEMIRQAVHTIKRRKDFGFMEDALGGIFAGSKNIKEIYYSGTAHQFNYLHFDSIIPEDKQVVVHCFDTDVIISIDEIA